MNKIFNKIIDNLLIIFTVIVLCVYAGMIFISLYLTFNKIEIYNKDIKINGEDYTLVIKSSTDPFHNEYYSATIKKHTSPSKFKAIVITE